MAPQIFLNIHGATNLEKFVAGSRIHWWGKFYKQRRLVAHGVTADPIKRDPVPSLKDRSILHFHEAIIFHTGKSTDNLFLHGFGCFSVYLIFKRAPTTKERIDVRPTRICHDEPT